MIAKNSKTKQNDKSSYSQADGKDSGERLNQEYAPYYKGHQDYTINQNQNNCYYTIWTVHQVRNATPIGWQIFHVLKVMVARKDDTGKDPDYKKVNHRKDGQA